MAGLLDDPNDAMGGELIDPAYAWMLRWNGGPIPPELQRYLEYLRTQRGQQGQQAQPAQMPAALLALSSLSPQEPGRPNFLRQVPGAGDFAGRMSGPMSGNIEDLRRPIPWQQVAGWLTSGTESPWPWAR